LSSSSSSELSSSSSFSEKLASFLKSGDDWSRLKTSVPGVFVLKMPAYKSSPTRLAVELNPVDASGSPTKRRGLVLRTKQKLDEFKELFQYDKLIPLVQGVESVNPQMKKGTVAKPGEDVLEI
jgi:hypothetical protein